MKQVLIDINKATDDEISELIVKLWNEREFYPLFLAVDDKTGFYTKNYIISLMGRREWIESANPSTEEIIEDMRLCDEHNKTSRFTKDINSAETWGLYQIKEYRKYLPNTVVFKELEYFGDNQWKI